MSEGIAGEDDGISGGKEEGACTMVEEAMLGA
jgi:hypothetical protein